jgi:hypothetical protein
MSMMTVIASVLTSTAALVVAFAATSAPVARRRNAGSPERGEGVVSVAIAVLIMAVLGAILFTAFKATTENAGKRTDEIVNGIK